MKISTAIGVLALLALITFGGWYFVSQNANTGEPSSTATSTPTATAAFACMDGKSVGAEFYEGRVDLRLSDGRTTSLPQTQTASGVRFANTNESFVFWGKGNTAFVTEGPEQDQTFTGCIVVAPDQTGTLSQIYATSTLGLTVRFPQGYTLDQAYTYSGLGAKKLISGIKMTVPARAVEGTNLSKDTYVSVEFLPAATTCSADKFSTSKKTTAFTDNGIEYSVATSSEGAAGNIYDEAVFAIPGSSPCTAVRYFIHSTNLANYPAGSVVEFNRAGALNEFDNIRRSLVLGR